ncbi:hypothetical protein [Viridibacillus arvi]
MKDYKEILTELISRIEDPVIVLEQLDNCTWDEAYVLLKAALTK